MPGTKLPHHKGNAFLSLNFPKSKRSLKITNFKNTQNLDKTDFTQGKEQGTGQIEQANPKIVKTN
jgi:hypothetical protein